MSRLLGRRSTLVNTLMWGSSSWIIADREAIHPLIYLVTSETNCKTKEARRQSRSFFQKLISKNKPSVNSHKFLQKTIRNWCNHSCLNLSWTWISTDAMALTIEEHSRQMHIWGSGHLWIKHVDCTDIKIPSLQLIHKCAQNWNMGIELNLNCTMNQSHEWLLNCTDRETC